MNYDAADRERELRQAIFTEALRTARTRGERARVIEAFRTGRMPENRAWSLFLAGRSGLPHAMVTRRELFEGEIERRAASEATGSAGGYMVPAGWHNNVVQLSREYSGLINDFELWTPNHGVATTRPVGSWFDAAEANPAENSQITAGPYPTLMQQSWGQTPTYAGLFIASIQVVSDALSAAGNVAHEDGSPMTLEDYVAQGLGESLGRAYAPVGNALVYSTLSTLGAVSDSGGTVALTAANPIYIGGTATTELAANTLSIASFAKMQAGLDPSYLAGAKYYMNRTQYAGLLSLTDSEGRSQYEPSSGRQMLLNLPLVVTNAVTDLTASTVSGPVLMNGKAAFTQRIVDDPNEVLFLRSLENRAEYAEVLYRSGLRVDFQPRDTRGVVGVAAQAS